MARVEPTPTVWHLSRQQRLIFAGVAALCWAAALMLLFWSDLSSAQSFWNPNRLLFYTLTLGAALLTFLPIQLQFHLPGLAFEGTAGVFLLFYTLAFVPAPTGTLLNLPDTPVYVLFAASLFWTFSALMLPLIYGLGRYLFTQRARQYDLRRSRRQAHGVGALIALCSLLAGMRVLTALSVILLALILIVAEVLFLSFVQTDVIQAEE
jgi:hypothetical protein